mmetsp:Transcript_16315/g.61888  ORF Transcript_16315/g.61888 Transcript_16315/m.61888 type:complete len:446 (+) Transcript_16315:235-1572(+)
MRKLLSHAQEGVLSNGEGLVGCAGKRVHASRGPRLRAARHGGDGLGNTRGARHVHVAHGVDGCLDRILALWRQSRAWHGAEVPGRPLVLEVALDVAHEDVAAWPEERRGSGDGSHPAWAGRVVPVRGAHDGDVKGPGERAVLAVRPAEALLLGLRCADVQVLEPVLGGLHHAPQHHSLLADVGRVAVLALRGVPGHPGDGAAHPRLLARGHEVLRGPRVGLPPPLLRVHRHHEPARVGLRPQHEVLLHSEADDGGAARPLPKLGRCPLLEVVLGLGQRRGELLGREAAAKQPGHAQSSHHREHLSEPEGFGRVAHRELVDKLRVPQPRLGRLGQVWVVNRAVALLAQHRASVLAEVDVAHGQAVLVRLAFEEQAVDPRPQLFGEGVQARTDSGGHAQHAVGKVWLAARVSERFPRRLKRARFVLLGHNQHFLRVQHQRRHGERRQ